jgi:hypothetical protein
MAQALEHARDGWNVFPLRPGQKEPLFKRAHGPGDPCKGECGQDGHGTYDGTQNLDRIKRWWAKTPSANIGANMGDDRLAIDVDVYHGGKRLAAFPPTREHPSGRGDGSVHLIYRYEPGSAASMLRPGTSVFGDGIDIRIGRGSYVVLPGSIHPESRKPYGTNGAEIHTLTDAELAAIYEEAGKTPTATVRGASRGITAVKPTPRATIAGTLNDLLQNPPARGAGQTNDWLTRVAGHYAKLHRSMRDLYETHVREAAAKVDPDYEDTEKVLESVWSAEVGNHPERDMTEVNGYLRGTGRTLLCQVSSRADDDGPRFSEAQYAPFDIRALGVAINPETSRRSYWVEITRLNGEVIRTAVDSETFGDERSVKRWLAGFACTTYQPVNASPQMPVTTRLLQYMESQQPPEVKITPTLGWHPELAVFVTHDGVITEDGPKPKEQSGVVADPRLLERDVAPFTYGFEGDEEEVRRVLTEVQTFQDETVTALFGAWWAACLLKPQIQERTSIFPFFGVEAASESGKTNGYFRLMVALNGNTRGQVVPTRPVLRDLASSNGNGIVWADDLDDLTAYGEILRASTSNGTASKMDIDRNGVKSTQIVAPIFITGEHLGMNSQKALADRAVVIDAASPVGRKSLRDPSRAQWDDILDLMAQYPSKEGLAVLAGRLQQMALQRAEQTLQILRDERRTVSGRTGDKAAVMLAGAHLLDSLLGHEQAWEGQGPTVQAVRGWLGLQTTRDSLNSDNTLTLQILPWAISTFHPTDRPEEQRMGRFQGIDSPVLVVRDPNAGDLLAADTEVWINTRLVAAAWARDHMHRVAVRTESEDAIRQQADRVCEAGTSKPFKVAGTSRAQRYRKLSSLYAAAVLARAEQ